MNDIEEVLRRELDDVAGHVRTRRVPVGELVAAGRSVRRRRRAAGASLSAAVVVAVLVVTGSVTGMLTTAPPDPARPPGPTATDWRVSEGHQSPQPSERDGIPEAETSAAMGSMGRWYAGLDPARASAPAGVTRPGYARWQDRFVPLPRGSGMPDPDAVAVGRARTARGLLVSWYRAGIGTGVDEGLDVDADASDAPQRLGWISPDGRWVQVDEGSVIEFTLSPDGRSYAYAVRDEEIPWVVTVRDLGTDAVSGRYTLPESGSLAGWNQDGLILTVPVHADKAGSGTYSWSPGMPQPVRLVQGWLARDVVKGSRVLAEAEAGHCLYALLDTSRPGPPLVQGCGAAALSPDGRYLVTGLTVTDLDAGARTTLAGLPPTAAGTPPRQAVVDTLVIGPARWTGNRSFEIRVEVAQDELVGLRCTVPRGPCLRLVG